MRAQRLALVEHSAGDYMTQGDGMVARLDEVSALPEPYPMWHQHKFGIERNPPLPRVRS